MKTETIIDMNPPLPVVTGDLVNSRSHHPPSAHYDFWRIFGFKPDPSGKAIVPTGIVILEASSDTNKRQHLVKILKESGVPPRLWARFDNRELVVFRSANSDGLPKRLPQSLNGVQLLCPGSNVLLPSTSAWEPSEDTPRVVEGLPELLADQIAKFWSNEAVVTSNPLLPFSLRGQSEKFRQMVIEAKPLLGEVCLRGQVTFWYAGANTGKTLIGLSLLIDAVRERRIAAGNVFYVNADDNGSGFATKLQLMDDIGANTLAPGFKGFRAPDLISLLHKMADKNEARGVFVVIDTVKKFTSLMDKKESSEFAQACRRVAMMGGTVLGLAHTTKNTNADGSPRYAGTTDLVDDADAAYTLNSLKGSDLQGKIVEFRCFKSRGACAERAAYAFAAEKGLSYEELLASVRPIDPMQIDDFQRVEEQRTDTDIIEAVAASISDGINTKMLLAKEVSSRTGISARAAGRLIERYTGPDPAQHRWQFKRVAHGAQVYECLPAVIAEPLG